MIELIKSLFALLTPVQRRRFYSLQVLVIITAFTELVGVAAIVPFMALVGDIGLLQGDTVYARLYQASGMQTHEGFLFLVGMSELAVLTAGACLSTVTVWRLSDFATSIGAELGDRLYRHYMHQPWLFHASRSSAQLTKQISTETQQVSGLILQPLMQLNSRAVLALFLAGGILSYNPYVAVIGLGVFGGAYVLLFKVVRIRLERNGHKVSALSTSRFRLMNEGFGGIKEITLLGRQADMVRRFEMTGVQFAAAQGSSAGLGQAPRYFMELLAFGSVIGLILFLMRSEQGDLGAVLPTLSVYALAGFKLLPALQAIYASVAAMKSGQGAFEALRVDLEASQVHYVSNTAAMGGLKAQRLIELRGVMFCYPGKEEPALDGVSMRIRANSTVGIVGPSGSGKSTAIDLLLGLIEPDSGCLLVDDELISDGNRRAWQNIIGYVPQSIFLSEGSIAENVAFGEPALNIDRERVGTVIDALLQVRARIANDAALQEEFAHRFGFLRDGRRLVLVTGHRRENFGDGFERICHVLAHIACVHPDIDVCYPVHLNPNVQEPVRRLLGDVGNVHLIEPQDYLPFVYLMNRATLILTDSGGVQEEAPSLGKPVLVMRDTTERPEAVAAGTVKLVGTHVDTIVAESGRLLGDRVAYEAMAVASNPYGDGQACARIVAALRD